MKNLIYIFVAVILVMFAACDKNEKNLPEEMSLSTDNDITGSNELEDAITIVDYNGMNLDFTITPINSTTHEGVNRVQGNVSTYEIAMTNKDTKTTTKSILSVQNEPDGSCIATNAVAGVDVSVMKFDQAGLLVGVENRDFELNHELSECVSKQFGRIMDSMGPLDSAACALMAPICYGLVFMSAVECCKGSISGCP